MGKEKVSGNRDDGEEDEKEQIEEVDDERQCFHGSCVTAIRKIMAEDRNGPSSYRN